MSALISLAVRLAIEDRSEPCSDSHAAVADLPPPRYARRGWVFPGCNRHCLLPGHRLL